MKLSNSTVVAWGGAQNDGHLTGAGQAAERRAGLVGVETDGIERIAFDQVHLIKGGALSDRLMSRR